MAYSKNIRKKVLEDLAKTPFIAHVARKHGIDRSTIYRWMERYPEFGRLVEEAVELAREDLCDVGEMQLVNKVKAGDMGAIKYFLSNNSPRYAPKVAECADPPRKRQQSPKYVDIEDQGAGICISKETFELQRPKRKRKPKR